MEEITLNLVEWSLSIQGTSSKVCGIALDVSLCQKNPLLIRTGAIYKPKKITERLQNLANKNRQPPRRLSSPLSGLPLAALTTQRLVLPLSGFPLIALSAQRTILALSGLFDPSFHHFSPSFMGLSPPYFTSIFNSP